MVNHSENDKDKKIEKIREFFDKKTGHRRVDKLSQAYTLMHLTQDDADEHKIELEKLHSLFLAYCDNPEYTPYVNFLDIWKNETEKNPVQKFSFWWKKKPDGILRKWGLNALKAGATLTAALGLLQYFTDIPKRDRQNYFQAWQLINTSMQQTGMGGRLEALKSLNEDSGWTLLPSFLKFTPECKKSQNTCLVGVKIEGANLNGVNLEKANLTSSTFTKTSFRNAKLKGAIFKDAHLNGANFSGAQDVNLDGAFLCGTVMQDGSMDNSHCKK